MRWRFVWARKAAEFRGKDINETVEMGALDAGLLLRLALCKRRGKGWIGAEGLTL